ncbi:hypothetical protein [Streptomyces puniciscabiei]|uniref:hypothetical protein n=1 Tax=Streptomyces puniciscabiei TaxID=164348 RepID=UPI0033177404
MNEAAHGRRDLLAHRQEGVQPPLPQGIAHRYGDANLGLLLPGHPVASHPALLDRRGERLPGAVRVGLSADDDQAHPSAQGDLLHLQAPGLVQNLHLTVVRPAPGLSRGPPLQPDSFQAVKEQLERGAVIDEFQHLCPGGRARATRLQRQGEDGDEPRAKLWTVCGASSRKTGTFSVSRFSFK